MPCRVVSHGNADSLVTMAQQILDNAPAQFNLAGHSMGGRVALEVLRLAPERVLRLGLLGTGFLPKEAGAAGEEEVKKRQALLDIARNQGVRQMALTWVQNMVAPSRLNDVALIEDIVQMFERKSEDVFKRQIKALLERPDASDVLTQVQIPTLVMAGEFDAWASPQQHQQIADLVPARPTIEVVVGAGHMMMMEKPKAVTASFLSWLTSN
jgi:pimeloyl-ACP methyl ester carboxylesterase